jgi:hypothetical protein
VSSSTFRRVLYPATTTLTTFYTAPAGSGAVVVGCQVANTTMTTHVRVDLAVRSGGTTRYLAQNIVVPFDAALGPITGKLILQPGDELRARSTVANSLDIILSVTEFA